MTIQSIGANSVALYITPADLKEYGLTPQGLTLERALELTRAAFLQEGMVLSGTVEIEAFPNHCGVLIFARVEHQPACWVSFPNCETLLAAAELLRAPLPGGTLHWCDGRYWLSLVPGDEGDEAVLCEFGRRETDNGWLAERLAEHGRLVVEEGAVAVLQRVATGG